METIQNRSLLYKTPASMPPSDLIPPGVYHAQLDKVQRFSNAFGDRLGLVFVITEGEHAGEVATLSTSLKMSRQSRLGKTMKGLLGRELSDAELVYDYKPDKLIGALCQLVLGRAATRAGKPYTTVENVLT